MEIRIYSEELRGPAAPGKEKQAQIRHLQKKLLRKALRDTGIYFAEQEELPQVLHTAYGKPYFPQIKDQFRFSLSHSGTMAMCVFSSDVENRALSTGCDIQEKRKTDLKIAERFFHPSEYELIMKEADHEKRTDLFYRLWTLKESCLKAAGTGTLLSMKDFRIELNTDENPSVWKDDQRMLFTFEEIRDIPGYSASYCIAEEHDPDGI